MWAIRVLNGPQAGHIFTLKPGKNAMGRGSTCEVRLASPSVSKEHAYVMVMEDKLIVSDLNSRNGTFVNGVRIQHQRLNNGDKIALHDLFLEVLNVSPEILQGYQSRSFQQANAPVAQQQAMPQYTGAPYWEGGAAPQMQAQMPNPGLMGMPQAQPKANSVNDLLNNFKLYFENVVMPGVYHFAQLTQYRFAIGAFVAAFVVIVTTLATVPMINLTKSSIQKESGRRALSIARNLATQNRTALVEKSEVIVSTRVAELEEGVTSAYIVSAKDGHVIAPANQRGSYPNKPFIHTARREEKEVVTQIDSSTVGASVPIIFYNSETGTQSPAAYAMIIYDMGSLALNTGQTFTLFIQILGIASAFGLLLFFFLYKVIEHPLVSLNSQLDLALKENRDDLQTPYDFPALKDLAGNISSALTRLASSSGSNGPGASVPLSVREQEAVEIVKMMTGPAIAISAIDQNILSANDDFDQLVGGGMNLTGRPISEILDPALQANIIELLPQLRNAPTQMALSEIPFGGQKYDILGHAIFGATDPIYYLICLKKQSGGD